MVNLSLRPVGAGSSDSPLPPVIGFQHPFYTVPAHHHQPLLSPVRSFNEPSPRQHSGLWSVLNRLVLSVIILAVAVGAVVAFVPILNKRKAQAQRIEQLRIEVARQKALLVRNTRAVELLQHNPEYIELMARDRLDMMKPGETIVRIDPEGLKVEEVVPAAVIPTETVITR